MKKDLKPNNTEEGNRIQHISTIHITRAVARNGATHWNKHSISDNNNNNVMATTNAGNEPGTGQVNQAFVNGERPVIPYGAINTESGPTTQHISTVHVDPVKKDDGDDVTDHNVKTTGVNHMGDDTGHDNKGFSPPGEKTGVAPTPSSYGAINAGQLSVQNLGSQHLLPKENGDTNGHSCSIPKEKGSKHNINDDDDDDDDDIENPRVYFRRWFMLFSFCMYSFSNAYQWINLNIIANLIVHYYNASLPEDDYQAYTTVDMLSMIYMIAYIPLIFPATWLLDRKGLRLCCIVGSFLNAVGAALKCFSVAPDRFPVLMVAQTICGISQIWVLGIPPRLAAVWFGPNQVSSATSIGVFGNQVGIAVGFLIPPILVTMGDEDSMTRDFSIMHYITAGVTIAIFIFILIFFRNSPPHPPSKAQLLAVQMAQNENYLNSLFNLFRNRQFLILMVAYGVNTGSFYAISTLLNTVILHYHEGEEGHAGQIGLTLVLLGVVGAIIGGIWLDRTKSFKSTTIGIYLCTLATMVAFTFTLQLDEIWVTYVTAGSLGFFMTGYLPVGFEFAAELTYPESEGTSSGLLNMSAQVFGVAFTLGMRAMMENLSVLGANITLCCFLLGGTLITAIIKPDYRRQEAGKKVLKEIVSIEESFPAKA